jgi:hypothetical protein
MRPLNSLIVIFLAHTSEVCNHDSWGMCTTSVEYKTVITAVLMVMSGMDPHMISGNLGWIFVKSWLGCVEVGFIRLWVGHNDTP